MVESAQNQNKVLMNKLCIQEERRCSSWPRRVFNFPILLLFFTFLFLFNFNYWKNIELAN